MGPMILSLCDHSGEWSRPYLEAGYEVVRIDLREGRDVRLFRRPAGPIRGILAAPPCCHFARSGARHWAAKGEAAILEGLSVVDACLRLVAITRPDWWALENPIGRLKDYLGDPAYKFDPCDFGDPYTKRTWLWGNFTPPTPLFSRQAREAVAPIWFGGESAGSRDRTTCLSSRHKAARSATPAGFARAFFEANP
jgi:hypothetical protein